MNNRTTLILLLHKRIIIERHYLNQFDPSYSYACNYSKVYDVCGNTSARMFIKVSLLNFVENISFYQCQQKSKQRKTIKPSDASPTTLCDYLGLSEEERLQMGMGNTDDSTTAVASTEAETAEWEQELQDELEVSPLQVTVRICGALLFTMTFVPSSDL